jgi:hypothetical protein
VLVDLIVVPDGFIIVGETNSTPASNSDKTQTNPGLVNTWVVKLSTDGEIIWDKTFGGSRVDRAKAIIRANDGGIVIALDSDSPASGDKTGELRGANDFWIVKLDPELPLPVVLRHFNVKKELDIANITWQTASETHSNRFEVEHSRDAKTWSRLASVNAAGESNALESYQFVHSNPQMETNYYRLKMVDTDGTFAYSKIEQVDFEFGFDVAVYPNPAAESIHLKATDWSKVKGLQILNNQGKTLYSSGNKPSQDISAKSFKPGLYFIKVTLTDGTQATRKIVVGQ